MGTLAAALQWAQRGFPVFPLIENDKEPAFDDWTNLATTDPERIRALWMDPVLRVERSYNIGCKCNGIVVVDIDVKNGKDGYSQYEQLGGTFDTLVVRTPTGGYHCYFNGPDSSNASIAQAVDVRSHNGYVVAPGSSIDGVAYEVVADRDIAWVPLSIEKILRPPYVRPTNEATLELDSPSSIEAGIRFLQSTPVALQGQRGDETTFITAARLVREMALSVPAAFSLMRDHWNDRCSPPWELGELYAKVENAAQYGTAGLGKLTPEALFGHLNIPPPPSVFMQLGRPWGNAVAPSAISPRPWLVERALLRKAVTLLLAAGSAGKSSLSLALAAHLSLGLDFAGFKTRKGCKTIVYNGEDDVEEQSRRLLAVCMAHGFDFEVVKQNIMLLSSREIKLTLAATEHNRPVRNDTLVEHIVHEAKANDVGLIILDPLVKIHHCNESDNVHMDFVMETLTDIADEANVAILALHHTAKSQITDKTGNMDVSRGASSIVNAARIAFTLFNASQEDAEMYGLTDDERNLWVRMDDAKMNMALAGTDAAWFRRDGVRIPSLDIVGVMRHEPLQRSRDHIRTRIAKVIIQSLTANGQGSMKLMQAVAVCKQEEPLWANKTDIEIRRRLEGMFTNTLVIGDQSLRLMRDANDEKAPPLLLLT